jgi:predicted HAD superfamily phosphohydrolase
MTSDAHWQTIRRIVALLAERRYEDVSRLCVGSRVSSEEMKEAVARYGRTIVAFPEEAVSLISSVEIGSQALPTWSVVVPLFTREEGRSDLSLELTVTKSNQGFLAAQVDNLHVL